MHDLESQNNGIDVTEIMEKIRSKVAENAEQGFYHHVPQPGSITTMIEANPIELDFPLESGSSWQQRLKRLMMRTVRKSIRWYLSAIVKQIQQFHLSTVQVLSVLQQKIDNQDLKLHQIQTGFERRCDSINDWVDTELADHKRRLNQMERRTRSFQSEITQSSEEAGVIPKAESSEEKRSGHVDIDYFEFEALFRGSEELIRNQQEMFVKYFEGKQNVLDIGCGRGEFLELCRENGIDAMGIDIDEDMVLYCQEKGLNVRQAEALDFLESVEEGKLGGVFMSQVVEHLEPNYLIRLIELCHSKQADDSYFISETINPESLFVFAHSYYIDMSHVFPAHPKTIEFLLKSAGYSDIEVLTLSPVPDQQKLQKLSQSNYRGTKYYEAFKIYNQNTEKLNKLLYGDQH